MSVKVHSSKISYINMHKQLYISHSHTFIFYSIPKQPTPEPTKSPLPQGVTLSPTMSPVPPEVTTLPSALPVSQEPTCLLITTGSGQYDNGYLDVYVNTGDGYDMVTAPETNWPAGSEVLNQCYAGLVGVQVTNSQTNAWAGSIESSTDGKITYSAMECINCTGDVSTTEYIVVDGDDNGTGDTKCLNGSAGNVCTLVNVVTTDEPTPEVSVSL